MLGLRRCRHMLSSENGLSDTRNLKAVASDDEVMPTPEIYTSDAESDPDMLSEDEDDFQPFALPDFDDDLPLLMVSLTMILLSFLFWSTTTSSLVIPMVSPSWL
ncbi:hypothetical protein HanHA300_Chr17g0666151 [Helianthus annuus]|nr:hypothetical protein HanHA300_Chr17g0666151 [Helianthus annuus]KAJ0448617.1 hypothetical protein HanHA89_Chr17g0719021 [Helianthus annuus]KAJ0633497.1 hypothetical protein HanLR1_Chr17g0677491 [Helianthus annuus]